MDLIAFLFRSSNRMVFGMMIASISSGILGAAVIALIHHALVGGSSSVAIVALGFGLVVLGKVATQFAAQMLLVRFAQGVILRLCRNLCDRVLAAPFDKLEAMGSPRLLTILNDDVAVLSAAVQAIPTLATNFAVIAGCSAYLAWLSWPVFVFCGALVLVGIAGYRVLLVRAREAIQAARDGRDRLFSDFRTLIEGIKELKLHRARRDDFVRNEIDETTELLRSQNVAAMRQYMIADVWSQLLFYALVAILLFVVPVMSSMSTDILTGYVFAALYMMNPVWSVIGAVPTFMRGRVSLAKIREIDSALETAIYGAESSANDFVETGVRIELERVVYTYPVSADNEAGFSLGPISLVLSRGELVFVTGGNGSGKSTLVKLLTGLYLPLSGRVQLNGRMVDDTNRDHYREHFSAVFADFHLFDSLFGLDASGRDAEVQKYLALLHMDKKVRVQNGQFSTTALSSGQRKRLALLTAYLEDRPVYVFDEWAADQDPEYKEIFYKRLLPDLRARGKTVVVITHDDRYFHLGDRILKLENGMVVTHPSAAIAA